MKRLKKLFSAVLLLPVVLLAGCMAWEVYGMCANHAAAARQTRQLQAELTRRIEGIAVVDARSETGNLSGTGNHVECASAVLFSAELTQGGIESAMAEYCAAQDAVWDVKQTGEGVWRFYMERPAPFPDNIEGH